MVWQPGYANLIEQSIENSLGPRFTQKQGQKNVIETTGDACLDTHVFP